MATTGNEIFMQFLSLSLYVFFAGFTFCDGFQLHILRKLIWFTGFLLLSIFSILRRGKFDLALILSVSSVLAITLCAYELHRRRRDKK